MSRGRRVPPAVDAASREASGADGGSRRRGYASPRVSTAPAVASGGGCRRPLRARRAPAQASGLARPADRRPARRSMRPWPSWMSSAETHLARGEERGLLDDVAQLAHVAGPVVREQALDGAVGEAARRRRRSACANFTRKRSAIGRMSSPRSRSGGSVIVKTLSR